MKHLFLVLAVATAATWADSPIRFDNFQVHRVIPKHLAQLAALRKLEQNPNGLNFWSEVSFLGQSVDIMVPPHMKYDFQDFLKSQRLTSQVTIEDVEKLAEIQRTPLASPKSDRLSNWKYYMTLDEIYNWLRTLAETYPEIVSVVVGGKSYEGRDILGVKVSFKAGNKAAFLEGGIHAREWIGPATVTYILNELLTSQDPNVRAVAESRDWYVFPSINPDGYVYTHTNNRMWRKTRQPHGPFGCYGADPNRNWGYHWMEGGASSNACTDTYAGPQAFSEIESKTLANFIHTISKDLDSYIAFHSYSQLLLIPFGHQGLEVPENNDELLRIGNNAAEVLSSRYGTRYSVGNIPQVIYVASGGSSDWVKGNFKNVRLTYTYELRDEGYYGFLLPPEQIIPTGEETLDSLVSIFQQADSS